MMENKLDVYKVGDKEFTDWTEAQDEAVELLNGGTEWVSVLIKKHGEDEWGMLQELNLARGVKPGQHWSTWTFAPYYWKMRNLGYLEESNEKD